MIQCRQATLTAHCNCRPMRHFALMSLLYEKHKSTKAQRCVTSTATCTNDSARHQRMPSHLKPSPDPKMAHACLGARIRSSATSRQCFVVSLRHEKCVFGLTHRCLTLSSRLRQYQRSVQTNPRYKYATSFAAFAHRYCLFSSHTIGRLLVSIPQATSKQTSPS